MRKNVPDHGSKSLSPEFLSAQMLRQGALDFPAQLQGADDRFQYGMRLEERPEIDSFGPGSHYPDYDLC